MKVVSIVMILAASIVATATLIVLRNMGIAQGQTNVTFSLTPDQKAAICDPSNPLSKLNPVNTTESKICGIPKTVKSDIPSANTTLASMTTGGEVSKAAPPLFPQYS
jgi:6-phosphofructokinase